MSIPALLTFLVYLIFLMSVGIYFYRKTNNIEDYLLGGRGMGRWVTALSAQASDMSGWLLMGLPGALYLNGLADAWIAIGLFIGTVLNWKFVAPRLRIYTKKTNSMTLSSFFEDRFKDPTGLLRIISAIITLVFFTIYASSGLVAAGKLFQSMFQIDYQVAVIIGALVIVIYTFMGGFLAVCWTDLFQGGLMFLAITVVPVFAWEFVQAGGTVFPEMIQFNAIIPENLITMAKHTVTYNLFPEGALPVLAVISTMAWGLGYFGQPHILARFMSIKTHKEMPAAGRIAIIWVFISLIGAVVVGLIAVNLFPFLSSTGASEKVFIYMIDSLFNPWIGGILLAAILSAIMSTIDSQLLVSSSALTEDFYQKIIKRDASEKELIHIGRICVLLISVIAFLLALNPKNTVLGLVSYAWGGFGAAFGPLVLLALFSPKTGWKAALAGIVTGTVVLVLWKETGLSRYMYEIVPGFLANFSAVLITNKIVKEQNPIIENEFAQVKKILIGMEPEE